MEIRKLVAISGIAAAALVLGACDAGDGAGGDDDANNVAVSFSVSSAAPSPASAPNGAAGSPSLTVSGTNGTLTFTEIHVIVSEVELEPADGSCDFMDNASDDDSDSDGECPDFESPPRILNLPLDGSPVQAVAELIRAGTYDELEFEIEDLEDDEDDPSEAAAILALREAIRADIDPDWPEKASARVVGNFLVDGGVDPVPFRVFLEAEIEVERDLVPNLVVADDGTTSYDLTVDIRPDIWFTNDDDTVLDLSAWDYATTLMLLELEVEMENGFTEVEVDDDDSDDDDSDDSDDS